MPVKKVMLVDDSNVDRKMLKFHLKKIGFEEFIETFDGASALELLREEKVCLIISDRYMQPMDGLALFKKLQEDKNTRDIPFLLLTAENERDKIAETIRLGIRNYVVKPIDPGTLVDKIKKMLQEAG